MLLLHAITQENRIVHPGHVAEWCPRCIAPAGFKIERSEARSRFLGIPVSGWKKRSEHAGCTTCKLRIVLDSAAYPQLSGVPAEIADLMRLTNPSLAAAVDARRRMIERARAGRLGPTEREEAVAEALRRVCKAFKPTPRSDRAAALIICGLFFGLFATLPVFDYFDHHRAAALARWRPYAIVGAWAASGFVVAWAILWLERWVAPWRRRKLLVMVGNAAGPFKPDHREVVSAVLAERARGNKLCRGIGAEVSARRIMRSAAADPFAGASLSRAA